MPPLRCQITGGGFYRPLPSKRISMKKKLIKIVICLLCAAALIALDQWTKSLAETYLCGTDGIELIPGVFKFHYVQNTGIAFGLFQGKPVFFGIVSGVITLGILWLVSEMKFSKRYFAMFVICTMLIAGSIGNLIDRLHLNYVIDFLYFSIIDFPVFNVADCYVTVSVILAVILVLFVYKDEEYDDMMPFLKKKAKKDGAEANAAAAFSGQADLAGTVASGQRILAETEKNSAPKAADAENPEDACGLKILEETDD